MHKWAGNVAKKRRWGGRGGETTENQVALSPKKLFWVSYARANRFLYSSSSMPVEKSASCYFPFFFAPGETRSRFTKICCRLDLFLLFFVSACLEKHAKIVCFLLPPSAFLQRRQRRAELGGEAEEFWDGPIKFNVAVSTPPPCCLLVFCIIVMGDRSDWGSIIYSQGQWIGCQFVFPKTRRRNLTEEAMQQPGQAVWPDWCNLGRLLVDRISANVAALPHKPTIWSDPIRSVVDKGLLRSGKSLAHSVFKWKKKGCFMV